MIGSLSTSFTTIKTAVLSNLPLPLPKHFIAVVFLILLLSVLLTPLSWLFASWFWVDFSLWAHLWQTQLQHLIINTCVLLLGVGIGVTILGVGCAWLIVRYEFPGRSLFEWALVLPLAIPAYVMAFVVEGTLSASSPINQWLYHHFSFSLTLPKTLKAIGVLTLVLYPYVYLLARLAFLRQSQHLIDVSRTLGLSSQQVFWRLALPLARPAIVVGVTLALMETAADFGAVSVLNYDTFTTAIYKVWYGFFNLTAAAQLACLLMVWMFLLIAMERTGRKNIYATTDTNRGPTHLQLTGIKIIAVYAGLLLLISSAFIGPVLQLLLWMFETTDGFQGKQLFVLVEHTASLALLGSSLVVLGSLILIAAVRTLNVTWIKTLVQWALMGYAVPGSVLAVAIMLTLNALGTLNNSWLLGGLFGLLIAYWVRFLSISYRPIETSLQKVKAHLVEAARTLGASSTRLWLRIYIPLILPGVLTAWLACFVEIAKEMPATLLLRPFGWDTLAVKLFELTSEGEWERAASPGLLLILVGLVPVTLLVKRSRLNWPYRTGQSSTLQRSLDK